MASKRNKRTEWPIFRANLAFFRFSARLKGLAEMEHGMRIRTLALLVVAGGLACGTARADSLSINFEGYSTGDLPGNGPGGDTRTPGGPNWWYPSNAATSAQVVDVGGNKVLNVYNNGNTFDGTIDNIHSPRLATLAGETGAGVQSGATANSVTSSYQFRTVSDAPVDDFTFKSESWGHDRTTWLSFFNDGSGNLKADYSGVTSTGDFTDNIPVANLNWGEWYTVKTTVNFVNGPDNDIAVTEVFDALNALVFSITDKTWETYFRLNALEVPGVDSIQFQSRYSAVGASNGVYVDNISISAAPVPLPPALWAGLALLGGVAGAERLRRLRQQVA